MNVDLRQLVPISRIEGDSIEDSVLLREMADEAKAFIEGFEWCSAVQEQYFGLGIGGVVAVYLCRVVPAKAGVDPWLWVVVGDLPPAYLVTDKAPTPQHALREYGREMRLWIRAVNVGASTNGLIPVNVPATGEWAARLESRLNFLADKILC